MMQLKLPEASDFFKINQEQFEAAVQERVDRHMGILSERYKESVVLKSKIIRLSFDMEDKVDKRSFQLLTEQLVQHGFKYEHNQDQFEGTIEVRIP